MNLDRIQALTFKRFLSLAGPPEGRPVYILPYDLYLWAKYGGVPYLGAVTFPC